MALHVMLQWGSMELHVALAASWRLWDLCGARMLECVAAIGGRALGAVAAVAAQHDHFDQVQHVCTAGHIHG